MAAGNGAQWPDQTAAKSGHFTALRYRLPFTKCGCYFYTVPYEDQFAKISIFLGKCSS